MMRSGRWFDDYGEDPVTRQSSNVTNAGTVTVNHVPRPPRPTAPGWTQPASNNPSEPTTTVISPEVPAKVVSQQSGMAPFETLFHDLKFEALPTYNFWEKEEEKTFRDRGNLSTTDLPRFIKLAWNVAPDLKDPAEFQKRRLAGYMPDAHDAFIQLSPFGFGAHAIEGTYAEGMNFVPEHLQPSHFEQNANQVANGHIFTGIIEAVVTAKSDTIVTPPVPTSALIDEDEYLLNHQVFNGIPFSEFNSALWRWKSSIFGLQQLVSGKYISPEVTAQKRSLFNGQFGLSAPTRSNVFSLSSQNSSSPSISLFGNVAASTRTYPISRLFQLADGLNYNSEPASPRYHNVKAKLIHTNMAGMMQSKKVNTVTKPDQAESIIAIAPVAANLAVYAAAGVQHYGREISIPSFNAPESIKPLEYIGYVIEKYEQKNGSYSLVDTIYIPGRDYDSYVDAKVKYGVSYRYRIRSIIRWSRPHGIGVLGKDPTTITAATQLATMTPNDVSYFASEWSSNWAYAQLIDRQPPNPPDEFTVRPHSAGEVLPDGTVVPPFIEITMKLPDNPQQDINSMVVYRKLQNKNGVDETGWVQMQEVSARERQGTRYIYAEQFEKEQDDITGTKFDIKNSEIIQTFVEFAPINSRLRDFDVGFYGQDNWYRYVYAAVCRTRHGEESVLSDQIGARLNPEYKKHGEISVDFVSCAGVSRDFDSGIFGTYPERRLRSEVISKPDVKAGNPALVGLRGQARVAKRLLSNSDYIMRVESLDNGQTFDIPVTVEVTNYPETVVTLPYETLIDTNGSANGG